MGNTPLGRTNGFTHATTAAEVPLGSVVAHRPALHFSVVNRTEMKNKLHPLASVAKRYSFDSIDICL